jgi:hypothetical protein
LQRRLTIESVDLRRRERTTVEFHSIHVHKTETREAGDGRYEYFAEALIELQRERLNAEDPGRSHIGRIGRSTG